jgi:hypothetical protein
VHREARGDEDDRVDESEIDGQVKALGRPGVAVLPGGTAKKYAAKNEPKSIASEARKR